MSDAPYRYQEFAQRFGTVFYDRFLDGDVEKDDIVCMIFLIRWAEMVGSKV